MFDGLPRIFMVAASSAKVGKESGRMERREHRMIAENQYQEIPLALLADTTIRFPERIKAGIRLASEAKRNGYIGNETQKFHRHAVQRLYLAIVNRAILDVLERGEHSAAAEQWLLSKDFDRLEELFG
jgi:hypothetical protein